LAEIKLWLIQIQLVYVNACGGKKEIQPDDVRLIEQHEMVWCKSTSVRANSGLMAYSIYPCFSAS
jgi:hypothetical protein